MSDDQPGRAACLGRCADDLAAPLPDQARTGALARRGAVWTVMQMVGQQVLAIGSTAVLSRILAPADYGVMAMASVYTALLLVFCDLGLSWASIRRRDLTVAQSHNLFWINAAVGLLLWAACAACGPWLAGFFREPRLWPLMALLGVVFPLNALSSQPLALASRRMRFGGLAAAEVAAQAAALGAALVLGLNGYGCWALAWQWIVQQTVRLVLLCVVSGFRPGPWRRDADLRGLVCFGGWVAAYGVAIYFSRNMDSLLVGRLWGTEEVGYYNRAYFLMTLPNLLAAGPLVGVMTPALAALRDDRERMGRAYRKAVQAAAWLGMPMALGLGLCAEEFVGLIYGPAWLRSAEMLRWLALAAALLPIHQTYGWLYMAVGAGRPMFTWGVVSASILCGAFALGARDGGTGVARAYALALAGPVLLPALLFAHRQAGLRLGATLRVLVPPAAGSLVMAAGVWLAGAAATDLGAGGALLLLVKIAVGAVLYAVASALWMDELPVRPLEAVRARLRALLLRPWRACRPAG